MWIQSLRNKSPIALSSSLWPKMNCIIQWVQWTLISPSPQALEDYRGPFAIGEECIFFWTATVFSDSEFHNTPDNWPQVYHITLHNFKIISDFVETAFTFTLRSQTPPILGNLTGKLDCQSRKYQNRKIDSSNILVQATLHLKNSVDTLTFYQSINYIFVF